MNYEKWDEILAPYQHAVEELKVKFKNIRKEFLTKGEYSPIEFIELLGLDNDSKQMTIDVLNQLNDSFKQFGYHIVLKIGVDD